MENEKEEEKPITSELEGLEPIPEEIAPSSSAEEPKPEVAVEPPEAGVKTVVTATPLEEYIAKLEGEVGTRRGENETPEAYALRLEVTKLRRERREERKEIFKPVDSAVKEIVKEVADDPLSQYNPEEVSNFEKLFDAISKKRGLVQKDELQITSWNDKAQDILENFQAKHKEYDDDALWDRFKGEFQSGKYNTHPQNPKLLTEIFNEIHNKLFPKTISHTAVAAGKEKIQAAAHGGTTIPSTSRKPIDPDLKAALKGFSDEELEELSQ